MSVILFARGGSGKSERLKGAKKRNLKIGGR
jgi:hypothetical protein